MGVPQFEFDGKTLDFPTELSEMERVRTSDREIRRSASGKIGSIFEHTFDEVEIVLDEFDEREFYRSLQAWWAWAAQGLEYGFALDKDDKINVLLDAAAAAAQKTIPLASTTGIVVGRRYRLRTQDTTKEEIIEVDTINAGVSVDAVDNLIWPYASGDTFRSEDYWPTVVSRDDELPVVEGDHATFDFKHRFEEAR